MLETEDFITVDYDDRVEMYSLKFCTWLVPFPGDRILHVTAKTVYDGGMVEFRHVDNGELAGSMGIRAFKNGVRSGEIGLVDREDGGIEYNN